MKNIRNFCIIAHIDHGKSTLADRLLQTTNTISERDMKDQALDDMDLERERGITIKSHAIQMDYSQDGEQYVLNLIDTPGHVDFSYEVSRSIAACEGALLIVDASQGIQAQTISNLYLAIENDLEIIPILNKMDLPGAMPEEVTDQIVDLIGCDPSEVIPASGKTGLGVDKILEAIIERIPAPKGNPDAPLQAMIFDSVFNPLMEFAPKFINVTYHREEYKYKDMGDGLLKKISIRKRPGTVGICAALMNKYKVDAVPHLICGGFNVEETENALIDLKFLGVDNILALRGDPIKTEQVFTPNKGGHQYAIELINQIHDLNQGKYLDEEQKNSPTDFCIGTAGYPEKHFEAMNLETDMKHLKAKVDAGAEYIMTQMFFDNQKYFEFVDKCRAIGINVPIIPGLKPITNLDHRTFLPKFFHIDFPMELAKELEKCKTNDQVRDLGIEWAINQSKELVEKRAPVLHFYTMGRSVAVKKIASEIF